MEQNKTVIFEQFAKKAAAKIEERKKMRTRDLYIKEFAEEIKIRALTDQEIMDCSEFSDNSNENDKYMIFMASKDLQAVGRLLVENKSITREYEVTNMFSRADRRYIAEQILDLSGFNEEAGIDVINEVDEVKNS